jgi:MFS family permease
VKLWPEGGLWRHSDFLKLWSAETVSQFGSQISVLALPFAAILVLHATTFEVASLQAVEFLPFLLVSLPAGVWVDRLRRRPILVVADLARAAVLGSVPIAYAFDALTIWQLYGVGFTVGVCTVFFDVAYQSYLPSLVERDQLIDGNSKLEISRSSAQIGGPGFAGVLVGWLSAPVAIVVDAVSFLCSALFLFRIEKLERTPQAEQPQARRRMRADMVEGLRYVLGHRYLRNIAAATATFNLFGSFIGAILLLYAVRVVGLSPQLIGLAFTLGNIGPLAGAFFARRISARFGVGPTILAATCTGGPMFLLLAAAPTNRAWTAVFAAAWAVGGFANVVYNVNQLSLRQAITPERIQGRMNSVMRFIVWGTIPLGALAGGALGSRIGLHSTIWIGAIGTCLPVLPVLFSPVRSIRELPEVADEGPVLDPLLGDAAAVTLEHPGT